MKREEIVSYWVNSSETDYRAMDSLFQNGHYTWALFVGHLVIEKLLKAYLVKSGNAEIPHVHDLLKIVDKSGLSLTEDQKDFLDEVTTFNIKARYPDYKKRFHRKATKEFTEDYIVRIREFREWLIEKISS